MICDSCRRMRRTAFVGDVCRACWSKHYAPDHTALVGQPTSGVPSSVVLAVDPSWSTPAVDPAEEIATLRAANASLSARSAALEEEREALREVVESYLGVQERYRDGSASVDAYNAVEKDLRAALSTPATPGGGN